MKRTLGLLVSLMVLGGMSILPAYAQRGGGGHAGGPGAGMGPGASGGMGNSGRMSGTDRGSQNSTMGGQKSPDQLLTQNTQLSSKLGTLLPAGTNVQQAAAGFKNLGQFVAAVHVSKNLGIPFEDLKSKMTGSGSESLGKAIHQLKPDADAKSEAKKAKKQADNDLRESESGS